MAIILYFAGHMVSLCFFFFKVNMICGPQFITPDVIARDCVLNDINFFMPVPICTKDAMITYGHIQVI